MAPLVRAVIAIVVALLVYLLAMELEATDRLATILAILVALVGIAWATEPYWKGRV